MTATVTGILKQGKIELEMSPTGIPDGPVKVIIEEAEPSSQVSEMLMLGAFSGNVRTDDEDFAKAEFHGDDDDGLDWS